MMKNLLIITYYFPPSGGPGVQRVLKHIKFLPQFGWNPVVFTVANGQYPARDESLLSQLPKDLTVIKSKIFEPYDIYRFITGKKKGTAIDVNTIKKDDQKISLKEKIAEFIRATFFIPDARMMWRFSAGNELVQVVKDYNIDAIYSSSPPYTCSILARNLKRQTGLPWVAGFRDPWTNFISSPKRWFLPAAIDRSMEFSAFNQADAVECAWVGIIKDALSKYPQLDKNKFSHVPNGFDADDYPKIAKERNKRFTVTYTGSLYGRRNPSSIFQAVENLISSGKVNKDEFLFRFVGRFGQEVEDMFNNASFKDSIERLGYVPHEKSIEYLIKSDALLLIVDESKESEEIVPGKVYEYLGTGTPILAIAPEKSAIADLIHETLCGDLAHQTEVEKLESIFMNYFNCWKNSLKLKEPNYQAIKKYERREAAKSLAGILDGLVKK